MLALAVAILRRVQFTFDCLNSASLDAFDYYLTTAIVTPLSYKNSSDKDELLFKCQ